MVLNVLSSILCDDYDRVDSTRLSLYSQMYDPLISETNIKRLQDDEANVKTLEVQALAAWQKIYDDNPWPAQPTKHPYSNPVLYWFFYIFNIESS
ncbi:hypothetical protein [Vibrio sp. MA40-2]|uniref:hypothetical protein n=1 Tax=Vibrio sp. MA40-2 TaxID=3391828 RepID=UPI0039A5B86E